MQLMKTVTIWVSCVAILIVLLVAACIPATSSGELRKRWRRVTEVQRLGDSRVTNSFSRAHNGIILRRWSTMEYNFFEEKFESVDYYRYRPWETVATVVAAGADDPPISPDTSSYPVEDEYRRVTKCDYRWYVGDKELQVSSLKLWMLFKDGAVVEARHRFGTLLSAELLDSEVTGDFDY